MRLAGKVAIITGGAHGMGESEALIFAREGANVVVADVDQAAGAQVAGKITGGGGKARFAKLDVTSEAEWQDVIRSTVGAYGRLDILVNNAGISGSSDPDTTSTQSWDNIMGVNANIVNISSISGFVGQDRLHMAYNASKGAVRIMTKSGAVQYARDGIRVNSVHPGFMPPMRTSKVSADPAWRQPFLETVPMKREGRVEEVAHAVLFLASDEASYITGTELVVDGGFLAV